VLDQLGLSATDAIGIGDSWNDVEMFEVVGTPVAMGNAAPELRRLAGRVTTAVLDDGVHNAFAELGLI
jgi:hydroxymethylpyrimidine pyrophosphatase-like HAD family hydrolase